MELKYDITVSVYREVEASIELHVAAPELFERWYRRFVKPEEIREV